MNKGVRTISLFSGCGGMDFGAKLSGADVCWANEIHPDACATLTSYFGKTDIICDDIKSIDNFPSAELVIGGYPCQSFSMGGNRKPENDHRTYLYKEYARCVNVVTPTFFIAENVSGLKQLNNGSFLGEQIDLFSNLGKYGYNITASVINARDYGVPQSRKRLLIVGVRRDYGKVYSFPVATHGKASKKQPGLIPYTSHGEVIKNLPLWPSGEFYERPHDPEGHWSWYYMSRNRKANWDEPSYAVVANYRHITLHPASPVMKLTWSNLSDGWKQRWDFSGEYEHIAKDPTRPVLKEARRLSWRECANIQTFPEGFEPSGKLDSKFTQIGNAVPPMLAKILIDGITTGSALVEQNSFDYNSKQIINWSADVYR